MSGLVTLRLANRGRKGVVKRLPPSLTVDRTATIEDVQKAIAKAAGVGDFNRIGVFNPQNQKRLNDRAALIGDQQSVVLEGQLLVQDLGGWYFRPCFRPLHRYAERLANWEWPTGVQIGWRTTFIIEYLGPILLHALWYHNRPAFSISALFYQADSAPPTPVQTLLYLCFQAHFIKRILETVFLHKFSANSMPLYMIFRNSALYWVGFGICSAASIYATLSPVRYPLQARSELSFVDYAAFALFLTGESCNFIVHKHLASLRPRGGTGKGIPNCIGSGLVTCPNYMFEVLAWVGVILICRDLVVVVSLLAGSFYMAAWSRGKEKNLRQTFPDQYKKKRYTFLPGII